MDKALGHQPPGQIALQLRTGDAVKNSISGDGRDKRRLVPFKASRMSNTALVLLMIFMVY